MSKDVRQWKSARRACQTSFSAHMQAHDGVPISTKCQLFVRQRLQGGHEFHLTIMLIVSYCSPCTSALSPPTNIQCGDSQVPWTMRSHASPLACTLVWAQDKGVDSIDSGWLNIGNLADGSFSQTRWTSHVVRILCADGCLGIIGHDYTFGSYGQWSISIHFVHFVSCSYCSSLYCHSALPGHNDPAKDDVRQGFSDADLWYCLWSAAFAFSPIERWEDRYLCRSCT